MILIKYFAAPAHSKPCGLTAAAGKLPERLYFVCKAAYSLHFATKWENRWFPNTDLCVIRPLSSRSQLIAKVLINSVCVCSICTRNSIYKGTYISWAWHYKVQSRHVTPFHITIRTGWPNLLV